VEQLAGNNSNRDAKVRTYRFALDIIKLVDSLPAGRTSMLIGDQLLRSGTSIGANIIEAQAGSSRKDFRNFLNHALKSANETRFWLALLRDSGKKPKTQIDPLLGEAKEISNILGASIVTLNKE
jgi:four helix bundle protein